MSAPEKPSERLKTRWTGPRLTMVSVLGALNGVISTPVGILWAVLNNGIGILGASLLQPYCIFTTMAAYLMPIPGVHLLSGTISGFANFLSGDVNGIIAVYLGVAGGIAGEIAMAVFRYRPEKRTWGVALANILFLPAANCVFFVLYGWNVNTSFWIGIGIATVMITLQSTLVGVLLARWVTKTGLLRSTPVSTMPPSSESE